MPADCHVPCQGTHQFVSQTIGLHFGGRDHSTVIHAYQSVEDQMRLDSKYNAHIIAIKRRLQNLGHV